MMMMPSTTRRVRATAAIIVVGAIVIGCGGSDKKYDESCGSSGDCSSGLTCPTKGPMSGKCTKACTKDEECASIGNGVCTSDVCAPK